MKLKVFTVLIIIALSSCLSTKSTLKNIDDSAPIPKLTVKNTFAITTYSKDEKYGYNKDYPINVFYGNTKNEVINQERFLNALAGPNGEKIKFKKIETCCPFPTTKNEMGVGLLDVYEITWEGQKAPKIIYFNIYEKGALLIPVGLSLSK